MYRIHSLGLCLSGPLYLDTADERPATLPADETYKDCRYPKGILYIHPVCSLHAIIYYAVSAIGPGIGVVEDPKTRSL